MHEETHAHGVSTKEVDTGAQIVAGLEVDLDPAEAVRVRCATSLAPSSFTYSERMHAERRLIITFSP